MCTVIPFFRFDEKNAFFMLYFDCITVSRLNDLDTPAEILKITFLNKYNIRVILCI